MFRHGATYAGHPTCCAAALANIDILEREGLVARGRELEGELVDVLAPLADHPACGEVRGGLGLAAAVDLTPEALESVPGAMGRYSAAIREAGVLLRSQATGVAIGPPLTVERAHLDEIATAVRAGLDAVAAAYEYAEPGGLIHLDMKRLGRFWQPGKRVLGTDVGNRSRHAGWQYLHVMIDDHSRLAHAIVLPTEGPATANERSTSTSPGLPSAASTPSACSPTTATAIAPTPLPKRPKAPDSSTCEHDHDALRRTARQRP